MSWFEKLMPSRVRSGGERKHSVPEGLWTKCDACDQVLYRPELERNCDVCPKCGHHMRISARRRLDWLLDDQSGEELAADMESADPLAFRDLKKYKDRLAAAQKSSREREALVVMAGTVRSIPVVAAAFEFTFMGGSMGSVVGQKFVLAVSKAIEQRCALVVFTASGGARMQESLLALFQMAKTSAALTRLSHQGLPFISVMTDPTMGGVSASFATLGDINIAEPGALIGFAGPRVIEQTVRETLPEGFQRAEFLLDHGAIDSIMDRRTMRDRIAGLLAILAGRPVPD